MNRVTHLIKKTGSEKAAFEIMVYTAVSASAGLYRWNTILCVRKISVHSLYAEQLFQPKDFQAYWTTEGENQTLWQNKANNI